MPKVISEGIVEIDGQKVNLKDFDDTRGTKEKGFYTHGTHASMQAWEDSVKVSGDGFKDAFVPKTPKTDCFYDNVSNWAR